MINNDTLHIARETAICNSFTANKLATFSNFSYLLLFAMITLLSSCGTDDEPRVVHIDKVIFSIEDQKTFGNNLTQVYLNAPDIFKPLDKEMYHQIYTHLNSTFLTLAQTIMVENRENFDWELIILEDDDRAMAFSAPGGKFFVYTGLLKYLTGEHELVALMAHEMFYSDTEKAMAALVDEFKSVPFLLGDIFLGNEIEQAKDVAEYMRDYTYTEEEVMKGDEYALQIICPFQYNASGLAQFVERTKPGSNIDWMMKRTGGINRIDLLKSLHGPCGNSEDDPTFSGRYSALVSTLP